MNELFYFYIIIKIMEDHKFVIDLILVSSIFILVLYGFLFIFGTF